MESVDAVVEAVARLGSLGRLTCRDVFERRFDANRMAQDYVELYQRL